MRRSTGKVWVGTIGYLEVNSSKWHMDRKRVQMIIAEDELRRSWRTLDENMELILEWTLKSYLTTPYG